MGMLMQLAAEQATNGTILPTKGGNALTRELRPRAVPEGTAGGRQIRRHQGGLWNGCVAAAVGVVDQSIETLIEPLPKHNLNQDV